MRKFFIGLSSVCLFSLISVKKTSSWVMGGAFTASIVAVSLLFLSVFVGSFSPLSAEPEIQQRPRAVVRPKVVKPKRVPRNQYGRHVVKRNNSTVTVISGEASGTHLRMAVDMANVLDDPFGEGGFRVIPVVGKGGVQNVLDVLFLKGIDMAIVSQGQLGYVELQDRQFFRNIRTNIQYIAKLYNSDFHILANRRIKSIGELQGKKVSFGQKLGETDMVARFVFTQIGIDIDVVNQDFFSGVQGLHDGTIEALVVMGGTPMRDIQSIKNPENYHFLPIEPKSVGINGYFKLVDEFLPTKISSSDYPRLIPEGETVPSISSSVVLVVYNWKPNHKRYKKLSQFIDRFFSQFQKFKSTARHPKWADVNINAKVPGWSRFQPAREWLIKRQQK